MDKRISAALVILGGAVIGAAAASDGQRLPATVACLPARRRRAKDARGLRPSDSPTPSLAGAQWPRSAAVGDVLTFSP